MATKNPPTMEELAAQMKAAQLAYAKREKPLLQAALDALSNSDFIDEVKTAMEPLPLDSPARRALQNVLGSIEAQTASMYHYIRANEALTNG